MDLILCDRKDFAKQVFKDLKTFKEEMLKMAASLDVFPEILNKTDA